MKNILKLILSFGFLILCGFIISTPKTTIVEQKDLYTEPFILGPLALEASADIEAQEEIPPEELVTPLELSIESIGVKAPIESVGVITGEMAVPTFPENVGWYQFGARPGDIGNAVLAGHVNWKDSPDAAFTNLKKVKVGDIIKVTNSDGEIISFLVNDIKRYPLYADTEEVFSSDDGLAHLNLITCDGIWNSIIRSHESRLVIFAVKFFES